MRGGPLETGRHHASEVLDEGGGVIDDNELAEGEGRQWNDHGPWWVGKEGRKDGFVSTHAVSILPEEKPLWGGPCRKIEIEEVDVRPTGGKGSEQDAEDPEAWENEIGKAGIGGAYVYSDGSLLESGNRDGIDNGEGGNVGGGAFVVGPEGGESEVACGIGNVATVWDGEVAGMADSQAA